MASTKKSVSLFICLFCLIFSHTARARSQEEASPLETLLAMSLEELVKLEVSVATGTAKPLELVPAVASVITAEEIEQIGATTLNEALETVPGLHVLPNGFEYFSPTWSIRGIQLGLNPHVLLLVNGVPFKSTYSGNRGQTFQMLARKISRVEVIRGPGSAVHGADAYAGVINVITKDGREINGTESGLRAGSFETYGGWLQHGGIYNGWDLALTIEGLKSGGDPDQIIDRDRLGSGPPSLTPTSLEAWHETVDLNLELSKEEWALNLYGSVQDDSAGAGPLQTITHEFNVETKYFLADLTYYNDDSYEDWALSVRLHHLYMYNNSGDQLFPASYLNMKGNPITTQKEYGLEATTFYSGIDQHGFRLSAGGNDIAVDAEQYKNWAPTADWSSELITVPFGPMVDVGDSPEAFMQDQGRSLWFLSLQDEWTFAPHWELTAGVRHDHYSDFGGTTNPRLALVWETLPELSTKLLYGQAFRAPSFAELYAENNVMAAGNPDLKPEKMESLELVFDFRPLPNIRTSLNLFTYKADNLIEFVPPVPQMAENRGEQEGQGFEFELAWQAGESWRLHTNFAYQHSENKKTGGTIHDTPEMQFYLNPHWQFLPGWSLDGQLFWIADRSRERDDPRPDIADYWLTNLTLRRTDIIGHWDVTVAVRNLLDEDAREPSPYDPNAPFGAWITNDYPLTGREIWAELRFHY